MQAAEYACIAGALVAILAFDRSIVPGDARAREDGGGARWDDGASLTALRMPDAVDPWVTPCLETDGAPRSCDGMVTIVDSFSVELLSERPEGDASIVRVLQLDGGYVTVLAPRWPRMWP